LVEGEVIMRLTTLLLAGAAATLMATAGHAQQVITLEAWTIGPDEPSEPRASNLERAAERLNEMLEAEGADHRVEVNASFDTVGWEGYRRRALLAFEAGEAPDIIQSAHVDVAAWADAGFIAPLGDLIAEHEEFEGIVPTLWEAVTYKGERWGVPQDTEARPLYFSKTLLAELGWSEDEIEALPERIQDGEFTWDDVIEVAKEAVEAGVVERGRGYWHRPVNGPDFFQFPRIFGGELQDPETGQLIYDTAAGEGMFGLMARMIEEGVYTADVLGTPWPDFHRQTSTGNVLFWSGGTWNWADWAENFVADRGGEEFLFETVGFALQPAAEEGGTPVTLSQPQAYMISADSQHKELAARLLAVVQDPEIEKHHFLRSKRPPILRASAELPEYQEEPFIQSITYMLDYATFQPVHPNLGEYSDILFRTLSAVEHGQFDAKDGAEIMAEELQRQLGDQVIVR
jgi:inositol-phosphate transport system substrate-binding protein